MQYAEKAKEVLNSLDIKYKQLFCNQNRLNEDGHTVVVANGFVIDNLHWRYVYPVANTPYICE